MFFLSVRVPNGCRILQLRMEKCVKGGFSQFFFIFNISLNVSQSSICISSNTVMWEFQDRPLEMSTPKYLALVTTSRICPCNVYTVLIAFLAIVIRTTWHLEGLNFMSHNDSLSRSFCSTVPSSKPPIVRYTAVSSANSRTCDHSFSGRSFIKTRNMIGS